MKSWDKLTNRSNFGATIQTENVRVLCNRSESFIDRQLEIAEQRGSLRERTDLLLGRSRQLVREHSRMDRRCDRKRPSGVLDGLGLAIQQQRLGVVRRGVDVLTGSSRALSQHRFKSDVGRARAVVGEKRRSNRRSYGGEVPLRSTDFLVSVSTHAEPRLQHGAAGVHVRRYGRTISEQRARHRFFLESIRYELRKMCARRRRAS